MTESWPNQSNQCNYKLTTDISKNQSDLGKALISILRDIFKR